MIETWGVFLGVVLTAVFSVASTYLVTRQENLKNWREWQQKQNAAMLELKRETVKVQQQVQDSVWKNVQAELKRNVAQVIDLERRQDVDREIIAALRASLEQSRRDLNEVAQTLEEEKRLRKSLEKQLQEMQLRVTDLIAQLAEASKVQLGLEGEVRELKAKLSHN